MMNGPAIWARSKLLDGLNSYRKLFIEPAGWTFVSSDATKESYGAHPSKGAFISLKVDSETSKLDQLAPSRVTT